MADPYQVRGATARQDFVCAIEDVFGVPVDEEESLAWFTVGDTYRFVVERFNPARQGDCLKKVVFYRLRQAMMRAWGVPREKIRTDTLLVTLMPPAHRREYWCSLKHALGLPLPDLRFPTRLELTVIIGGWRTGRCDDEFGVGGHHAGSGLRRCRMLYGPVGRVLGIWSLDVSESICHRTA